MMTPVQGAELLTHEPVTARELRRDMVQVFGDSRYKAPVLPAAAHELMELSKRPNVSFEDVQRVVEKDTTIAGKVLQVAQSPIYATRVRAKTLRDAVQRLGLNNIRDIVWQVAMDVRVFRAEGYEGVLERLQSHCVATGYLARLVCRFTSVASEYAFLCGLLHDVGLSGLLISVVEKRGKDSAEGLPPLSVLWPALTEAHAEASGYLARLWKLDKELELVVAKHHQGEGSDLPHPLVAVLAVAEHLATEAGHAVLADDEGLDAFEVVSEERLEGSLKMLGVNDATLRALQKEASQTLDQMKV
ncbi:MAG: HDOD domain-containing protein [Myxococcales bacterium]|nr:HDOD domain-containing protein [Myxococcales bacterium]MDD9965667.1 HDOD domain-containing protein [Myxococcales bacterium]